METHKGTKDDTYVISAISDTTLTDVESGFTITVYAGTQIRYHAISDQFTTDGECIVRPFR